MGGEDQVFAIGLALLSALMFAFTFTLVRIGVKTATSETALWITLLINVVFLWGWSLLSYGWQFNHWWEWRYFMLAGLFAPLLGRLFQFLGMAKLGSNITTPLTLTHPVVTVVLAIAFLGERLTFRGLIGVMLVVAGSVLVGSESGRAGQIGDRSLAAVPRKYLIYPAFASLCYGVSMIFRKIGIDIGSDAVTASAVTTSAAWLSASLYTGVTSGFKRIQCTFKELCFFFLAGIFSALGPVLLYVAMQYADLVVVAPLAATTPLFVLLMSYFFIRADEIFTFRVVAGTLATVTGVILVTVYGLA